MMQEIKIKVGNREYTINNNNGKYDRAKKDAGENASLEQILAHYDKLAGLIKDESGNKMENGQFWERENKKIFIERAVTDIEEREKFHLEFLNYLKKEQSNYAKLILQENLISYEIISLLFLIHSIINTDFLGKNSNSLQAGIYVRFSPKELQTKTLGQLIQYLSIFLNNHRFTSKLSRLNDLRNKITHNIFNHYQQFADVHKESERAVVLGSDILDQFEIIIKDIIKLTKGNMIKEIKSTDTLGNSRILINDNFKELNERLKKVEEILKKKKIKK